MLILHISDIHFKTPDCLDPDTDPDKSVRTRIENDIEEQLERLGDVDAILVGGDIAYKGAKEEYEVAWEWFEKLLDITGCAKERLFVVPGNHDVDRGMVKDSMAIRNAQEAIAAAPHARKDRVLKEQLADEECGQALFRPLAEYNEFAAPLNCQIWPKKPFWAQDIELNDEVKLRIFGLSSILISGGGDRDAAPGRLYLGSIQTVLNPEPDIVNMVLMHHPPGWFVDEDAVNDDLQNRAMFHLFGHKHRQRVEREEYYIRMGAGAVNPSRDEGEFQPGYNFLDISVAGTGEDRVIEVALHQRIWQQNPERMISIQTREEDQVFRKTLVFPARRRRRAERKERKLIAPGATGGEQPEGVKGKIDAEAAMGDESTRDLLFRFWHLPGSARRKIMNTLKLLEEDERSLPEPERYGRAFIRAGKEKRLAEVAAEITRMENS